jgi:glyoxylase-like metal-dependent hydrolase (beta-lactamase superfamily II)
VQAGRGALGIAILGVAAACGGSDGGDDDRAAGDATDSAAPSSTAPATESPSSAAPEPAPATGPLAWSRVDLGFVAAYVLVRGNEAAVVDTGVGGSGDAIGKVLDKAGPGWAGVRHVVLTHKHGDHAGSISEVLEAAPRATGYLGTADLPEVDAPRTLTAIDDGDDVFGLQIIGSPGHTLGHMAVFDADTGVLFAGDALGNNGGLSGSNPQFTEDEGRARATVAKLARLAPKTILVGHGPPITSGAASELDRLAASL